MGGQIKPRVRSKQKKILNFNQIIPIDNFEMRSSIWGVRSSLRSDQNENIPNFNPII